MSGFNRAKILQYSDEMEIKTEKETNKINKMKKKCIYALKIFLVPIVFIIFMFTIMFLTWGVIQLISFLWGISKILAIGSLLIIIYLFILLYVIVFNIGGN